MKWSVLQGDAIAVLRTLPDGVARTCVTSPPYWGLRDYGVEGQIGLETTPSDYVETMVEVFREVRRLLADDGTLWLNLGDSYFSTGGHADGDCADRRGKYNIGRRPEHEARDFRCRPAAGLKPKDLVGIPWRVALALQADGWWLRSDDIEEVEFYCPCGCGVVLEERVWRYSQDREVVWKKPNPMPESVRDRPTRSHEYLFLLTKSERYFYDAAAIAEPAVESANGNTVRKYRADRGGVDGYRGHQGCAFPWKGSTRNKRSVWTVTTKPFDGSHFAVMPEDLVEPCVLAGSGGGDVVLDPFCGSGTTGVVALKKGRSFVGVELNAEYVELARKRIGGVAPLLAQEAPVA